MTASRISVIVPVYNGAAYLAQAIDSILQQTWPSVELIVVDDGSIDGTASVAQSYGDRLIYHYQQNQGQGQARNAGIALASGDLIAFLDADDVWLPEKLSRQMRVFAQDSTADMVFGWMEMFHSPELSEERRQAIRGHGEVMAGCSVCTLLVRKEAFRRVGMFLQRRTVGEFMDWYLRAKEAGLQQVMLEEVVMRRRLHNNNMGIRLKDHRHEYLKVLKESLDRRNRK
jgi:glycosyltransferase involved in cell wall biosynthesis